MTIDDYLALPYHLVLLRDTWHDGTDGWFVRVDELEGCMSQGRTPDEAVTNIRDAMVGWLGVALEEGAPIPLPRDEEREFSGRVLLRMPRSLHATLARIAEDDGVSLNQTLVGALSFFAGARTAGKGPATLRA